MVNHHSATPQDGSALRHETPDAGCDNAHRLGRSDRRDERLHKHRQLGANRRGCLTKLGRASEAPVLQKAREVFRALQAAPALAETDELQQQATTLTS